MCHNLSLTRMVQMKINLNERIIYIEMFVVYSLFFNKYMSFFLMKFWRFFVLLRGSYYILIYKVF